MLGCNRFKAMRDQGTSMEAGFGMEIIPTAPACAKGLPALARGLMVRRQRRGDLRRRAGDQDRDFALEIEPGEIVEIFFWNAQAITDKYQRSFDLREPDRRAC